MAQIIEQLNKIENSIQRLLRIINKDKLKGGLGYSELDYEKTIFQMRQLENNFNKLPSSISLSQEFINICAPISNYYAEIIEMTRTNLKFNAEKIKN